MNPTWRVVYYESKDGRCEIIEFIEACGKRDQAKLLSWIELLAETALTYLVLTRTSLRMESTNFVLLYRVIRYGVCISSACEISLCLLMHLSKLPVEYLGLNSARL